MERKEARCLHYAEQNLKNHSIDLTIYNVHEYPKLLDFQVLRKEEIVLILSADHPLAKTARPRDGFRHPRINMGLLTSFCCTRTKRTGINPNMPRIIWR